MDHNSPSPPSGRESHHIYGGIPQYTAVQNSVPQVQPSHNIPYDQQPMQPMDHGYPNHFVYGMPGPAVGGSPWQGGAPQQHEPSWNNAPPHMSLSLPHGQAQSRGNIIAPYPSAAPLSVPPAPAQRPALSAGHGLPGLLPESVAPPPYSIIEQDCFKYTNAFSRTRYSDNFGRHKYTFCVRGARKEGIAVQHLLHGGGAYLCDADMPVPCPDDVASIVVLRILIKGCPQPKPKIIMRIIMKEKGADRPVTVNSLASQIAKHVERYFNAAEGQQWAASQQIANLSQVILVDYHRVVQGSWQITLGKCGLRSDLVLVALPFHPSNSDLIQNIPSTIQ
ncbi:hypothetical protein DENSPDRAFT_497715 [Dentipellis sp. KUC8613]|nr:hypothetical protein DENSPDRAFT_497715 [Dentipellis sp. KUC8613]